MYTCALNSQGGCEADVTVTALDSGLGELHDPIFKVSYRLYLKNKLDLIFFYHLGTWLLYCRWWSICLSNNFSYKRINSRQKF